MQIWQVIKSRSAKKTKKELKKVVKKNKVIALLMAGVMTILQPASIYAADMTEEAFAFESEPVNGDLQSEQETVEDDDGSEILNDEGFISDFDTVDASENIEEDFTTSDEIISEDAAAGEQNTQTNPLSLTWDGIVSECNEQNVLAEIKKEDGTELSPSEMLILNSINQDVKKELENKIQKQMIGMSVSGAWAFNLARKDGNGNDIEKNAAYRIQIKMMDVSKFKNMRLYHQKENGDMEEITFTSGISEDNMQKLEFVSSNGLGDFIFAGIEKDLTVTDSVNESVDETIIESSNSGNEKESNSEGGDLTVNDNGDDNNENKQDSGNTESDSVTENSSSGKPSSQDENTVDVSSNLKAEENSNSNDIADKLNSEGNAEENKSEDAVIPIDISEFHASLVSGADKINDKYIWNPSDSAAGHSFIYRVNYTMSGTFSTDVGAFKIEVPLHILKDKDGNCADAFTCPYRLRSSITENDNPDFVYEIDEENNKAIIYNYKPYPTGEAGYVEFAYETTKDTTNYTDMTSSTKVPAKVYATSDTTTVTKESEAEEVYIDTHATVAYTQKKKPTLYKSWNNLWGQEPEDASNYYYLVWPIRTYINKNTSAYDLFLHGRR